MRTSPTLGQSANNTISIYSAAVNPAMSADMLINSPNHLSTGLTTAVGSGQTSGQGANIIGNNSTAAFLEFIAEL